MSALSNAARLRSLLPRGWFPDAAPVLDALLAGMGAQWDDLFDQLAYLRAQTRLSTATDAWLDSKVADFLGVFPRRVGEGNALYSQRARREVIRARVTRDALVQAIGDEIGLPSDDPAIYIDPATGAIEIDPTIGAIYVTAPDARSRTVRVFEPTRPADTGSYSAGGAGYGLAGGYGSLSLPFQFFVSFPRPSGIGLSDRGGYCSALGYGTGGGGYGHLADMVGGPSDADLYATVARTIAAGTIAWTQITGGSPPPQPFRAGVTPVGTPLG